MISGNIGSSSLKCLDYTVIVDVVNTAPRLQSVATENQIVLNEAYYQRVKELFRCQKIGNIILKHETAE